jgi:hypothetical protein
MINIAGLNKTEVLLALHKNSKAQGMSFLDLHTVTLLECEKQLAVNSYVDYFAGKVIKCDFSGDMLDPRGYDRDLGKGAAERAINGLAVS